NLPLLRTNEGMSLLGQYIFAHKYSSLPVLFPIRGFVRVSEPEASAKSRSSLTLQALGFVRLLEPEA
ncbi:MAG TPA: hypothetical protein VKE94_13380, partial [Gemmataceae bacterium]|nr:hypothetical protein [Gemmataceae bacterium]